MLDPYHRQATNLVMTAGAYTETLPAQGQLPPAYAGVTGAVKVGAGASVIADAGADIGFGSPAQVTVLGTIVAHGGSITLSAGNGGSSGFVLPGQSTVTYTTSTDSVWIGSDAVLDVSGVALINPFVTPVRLGGTTLGMPVTGKVLDGGSVVLSDSAGYVVTQADPSSTFPAPRQASICCRRVRPVSSAARITAPNRSGVMPARSRSMPPAGSMPTAHCRAMPARRRARAAR